VRAAVRDGLARDRGRTAPARAGWRLGEGSAVAMIATVPPRGHHSHATIRLEADGAFGLDVGTAEFGNGTSTVHQQIAATVLQTTTRAVRLRQADSIWCRTTPAPSARPAPSSPAAPRTPPRPRWPGGSCPGGELLDAPSPSACSPTGA
jgi:CO/xanthine dehydrogenase Mo-binding subunit